MAILLREGYDDSSKEYSRDAQTPAFCSHLHSYSSTNNRNYTTFLLSFFVNSFDYNRAKFFFISSPKYQRQSIDRSLVPRVIISRRSDFRSIWVKWWWQCWYINAIILTCYGCERENLCLGVRKGLERNVGSQRTGLVKREDNIMPEGLN